MRHGILALGALLWWGTAAAAQSDPPGIEVLPPGGAPIGHGTSAGHAKRPADREAERAAALARGRERFFHQQSGFDHTRDDPTATGAPPSGTGLLPDNILPNVNNLKRR